MVAHGFVRSRTSTQDELSEVSMHTSNFEPSGVFGTNPSVFGGIAPPPPVPESPIPPPPELPDPVGPIGVPPPMENPIPVREPPVTLPPQS